MSQVSDHWKGDFVSFWVFVAVIISKMTETPSSYSEVPILAK